MRISILRLLVFGVTVLELVARQDTDRLTFEELYLSPRVASEDANSAVRTIPYGTGIGELRLIRSALRNSPEWDLEASADPPVSLLEAIGIAKQVGQETFVRSDRWRFLSAELRFSRTSATRDIRWFWHISFLAFDGETEKHWGVFVLMDGKCISPGGDQPIEVDANEFRLGSEDLPGPEEQWRRAADLEYLFTGFSFVLPLGRRTIRESPPWDFVTTATPPVSILEAIRIATQARNRSIAGKIIEWKFRRISLEFIRTGADMADFRWYWLVEFVADQGPAYSLISCPFAVLMNGECLVPEIGPEKPLPEEWHLLDNK